MNKKYVVTLTAEERAGLHQMISAGKAAARKRLHAQILLKADAGPEGPCWTDGQISLALEVSSATIQRVRQQFVEQIGRETVRQVLKKRTQALAQRAVLYSTESECRFCLQHGGGVGRVQASV